MKVILHIGWHKTGTSAIQYLLHVNRALLREKWRLNYPEAGIYDRRAHHVAAWKLIPRFDSLMRRMGHAETPGSTELFRAMLRETAERGCTAMLISSEVLSQIQDYDLARLAEAFEGNTVEIVGYVRRQDRYLESRYNQWVKGRRRLSVGIMPFAQDFLGTKALDYHDHFGRWAAVFGRESLKVRLYDRASLRRGDVRLDFIDALGIEEHGLDFEDEPRNVSLTFSGVQFLRRFNSIPLDAGRRRHVLRALDEHAGKHPGHTSLFLPHERLAIMDEFRESNRLFARAFLGREEAFEIPASELEREAGLDRTFGEEQFLEMLAFVLPRVLALPGGADPRRKSGKDARKARKRRKARGRKAKGKRARGRKRPPAESPPGR
jgi:hypothetical protein